MGGDAKEKATQSFMGFLPSAWRYGLPFGLLLVAAIMIAYHPAWHAGFIWDDNEYVTANPLLSAPDGLWRIWFSLDSPSQYFPLTYTTFYIERSLWGLNPAGYHLVNLLLHGVNALLVWRVLTRLRVPGAWLAGMVFALHPVQVESVAWITERKNVLMGFFFLLTLMAWIKFIETGSKRQRQFYLVALPLYALSLFSKTTACTLPAALILILWLKKMPINRRSLVQIAPFLVLGIGMGVVTVWWERHHQGTQSQPFNIGLMERILIASRSVWFYAGKLLWPTNLAFSYPHWTVSASDPGAYGWLLATAALGIAIWQARRWTGRSVEVAVVYFVATLGPILGFIMLSTFQYSFVADHYQYLACIGPIALATAGLEIGLGRISAGKICFPLVLGMALLLTLGALTWKQCGMYADAETLWRSNLRLNPDSWMAHNNLGFELLYKNGQVDEAITHFQKSLEINPDNAEAHINLGNCLCRERRIDEAIVQYRKALEIKPDHPRAHNDLGLCLFMSGRMDEAIAQFQKALEIQPDYARACFNLGNLFNQQKRMDEAIAQFQKALEIQPDFADARMNLGDVFSRLGRTDEAITQFQRAAEIQPDNAEAYYNLGNVLAQQGRIGEAITQYEKALRIKPDDADTHYNLAGGYFQLGRTNEAITHYRKVLKIQPNNAEAQLKLYQAGKPFHIDAKAP